MDRTRLRSAHFLVGLVLFVALILPAGCGWMALTMYNLNPDDVPAEFKDLKDRRVVVVCRPVVELQFADSTVPRDLTRQVGGLLHEKVRKLDLVDEREVSEWVDENTWQKFTEVGKALKADTVIGIELEHFTLQQGPTLFQGNANVRIVVYDMRSGGRQVYEKSLPQVLYPTHTPIPSSETSEGEFRRKFLGVLAERIGRHFYSHDSRVDFATDANL
jgi:hypothetical protein